MSLSTDGDRLTLDPPVLAITDALHFGGAFLLSPYPHVRMLRFRYERTPRAFPTSCGAMPIPQRTGAMPEDESVDVADEREAQVDDQAGEQQDEELGEGGKAALEKEREARKRAETDLKRLNKRLQEIENAGKSEEERRAAEYKSLQDRAEAAEQRLRAANARSAVADAATKLNAVSVGLVYKYIKDDIEFDDDGEPTNIKDLLAQARKEEPHLFRASAGSADGAAGGDTKTNNVNDLFRALAKNAR